MPTQRNPPAPLRSLASPIPHESPEIRDPSRRTHVRHAQDPCIDPLEGSLPQTPPWPTWALQKKPSIREKVREVRFAPCKKTGHLPKLPCVWPSKRPGFVRKGTPLHPRCPSPGSVPGTVRRSPTPDRTGPAHRRRGWSLFRCFGHPRRWDWVE